MAEHPATPRHPDYPTISRSAIVQVLLRNGNCQLECIQQYRWGCEVRKPTGLLHCNMPRFRQTMYERAIDVPWRRLPLANRAISSELRPTKSILHCWVKHLLTRWGMPFCTAYGVEDSPLPSPFLTRRRNGSRRSLLLLR